MVALERLKEQFLELLEKDVEFRYAVAGYLGLSEVLRRLDSIEEGIRRLWEEVKALREDQRKLWEGQNKLWENQNKLWEEVRALREAQGRLWESQSKLWEEVRALREDQRKLWENQSKLWEEVKALREDQRRLWEEVKALNVRVSRVERTLEKLTLDVEEEARIVVEYRLRGMGYELKVSQLILPEVEVDIYGAAGDLCVVGEARVRASARVLDELDEKVELLRRFAPDRLRPRVLRVVYASLPLPDLVERAEREGVWVLKATGDVVKPRL